MLLVCRFLPAERLGAARSARLTLRAASGGTLGWTTVDIPDILGGMSRRKILVTLDDGLVRRLDRVARERGLSRSALLADLTERELGRRTPERQREIDDAVRAMRDLGARYGTGDEDAPTAVRRMRDERTARLVNR
jgi:hypothetical protein